MKTIIFLVLATVALISATSPQKPDHNDVEFLNGRCIVDGVHIDKGSSWATGVPCAKQTCTGDGISALGCPAYQGPEGSTCVPDEVFDLGVYPICCQKLKCKLADGSEIRI